MPYIVDRRLKIKRKGEYIWLESGEMCPEAEQWENLKCWVDMGYLRFINRPISQEVKELKAKNVELELKLQVKGNKEEVPKKRGRPKKEEVVLSEKEEVIE